MGFGSTGGDGVRGRGGGGVMDAPPGEVESPNCAVSRWHASL